MKVMLVQRPTAVVAGGVQRSVVTLANGLVRRGHEVSLFSWDTLGVDHFYELSGAVKWYKLGIGDPSRRSGLGVRAARLPKIRRIVQQERPDVIICFLGGPFLTFLVALAGLRVPLIVSERNAPTLHAFVPQSRPPQLTHFAFRMAAAITVQFERYRNYYPPYLRERIVALSNPVTPVKRRASPEAPDQAGRYRLLTIGRLSRQKNLPVLISAFGAVAERFPQWDLVIVGEGRDRAAVEAQVAADGRLAGRVSLPGATKNVNSAYLGANLFCLASLWEGFPNVLGEALAHGLPAVGFAGCPGVPDLIEDGVNGFLAPGNDDADSLAAALSRAMQAPEKLAAMGAAAVRSVEKYAPDEIFAKWERLLEACRRR